MGLMDRLIDYVASDMPGFAGRIQGVAATEVRTFETLVGKPLPESYKDFLSRMGRLDGGLELHDGCRTGVAELIDAYRRYSGPGCHVIPPDGILIGVGDLIGLGLDLRKAGEPAVALVQEGDLGIPYADSLEALLFRRAFARFRLRRFPCRRTYEVEARGLLGRAESLARELGFRRAPFSDSLVFCGEQEKGAVKISQQTNTLFVMAACRDSVALDRVAKAYARELDAKE